MNRLREIREDKDLNQTQIAKKIGISQRKYSYIETGTSPLTSDILEKLAEIYETSVDYLLYRTDEIKPYTKSILNNKK